MIFSYLFIALAAMCNAIMDTCVHHYSKSIFNNKRLDKFWWDGSISWLNKYNLRQYENGRNDTPIFLTDAWHFFKSLMVIFIILSVVCYEYDALRIHGFIVNVTHFILLGFTWNSIFLLFYKYLLIKNKK